VGTSGGNLTQISLMTAQLQNQINQLILQQNQPRCSKIANTNPNPKLTLCNRRFFKFNKPKGFIVLFL
jgi:hypothetical protein